MVRRALCGAIAILAATACGSEPEDAPGVVPGEIIGRVEISADVPASGCRALLEGSPLGAPCDESGAFDLRGVPPGRWDVRIVNDDPLALPGKRVAAGANSGFVTDLGAIRLAKPGAIGGRVIGGEPAGMIVALPAYGVVTAPNDNGGYLLLEVPPGVHDVVLIAPDGTVVHADVTVVPERTTIGVDLDLAMVDGDLGPIVGRAIRGDGVAGGDDGITVELVDAITGDVEVAVETDGDGAFSLASRPGVFAVRARDGDSPITAIVPSVVPRGELPLVLPSTLVLPLVGGDLDADGTPDDADPDIDGDGVANAADAFPYDPAETADADGDGLGDRADLATQGDDVDTHNDTPDTDDDGRFDFEDVCPEVADPAQADRDGDGDGDACDNCPNTYNDDQEDSVGDGVGDACRACAGSEDCPDGMICAQGSCVGCVTSSQCGDQVCSDGACVPCTATLSCGGERVCNVPVGACQECLVNLDCDSGEACVAGRCFAQCVDDVDCPGAFCVDHACVACRDNADCASDHWCDAGLCTPGCTTDAACTGGRVCDLPTRTCVLPCSATCPTGQTCDDGGLCRAACDGSFPCPGNLECDPVEGVCVPQCTLDTDCGAFQECQLGQCVASGDCAYDTDCGAAEMCGPLGACVPRPTSFDAVAGAYTCDGPCDCKLGETCAAGHCVADGFPSRFVAAGAPGDGTAPDAPTGDLAAAIAGRAPDEVVAIRGGDTIDVTGGAIALPAGVRVQGGYTACSTRRWVRDGDDLSSSRIRHGGAATPQLFDVPGTFDAPRAAVTIRGLTLESTVAEPGVLVDARLAPGLWLDGVTLVLPVVPANQAITGVRCEQCLDVTLDRVALPAFSGAADLTAIELHRSSGLVRDPHLGTLVGLAQLRGVWVRDAIGPVTVDGMTTGDWSVAGEASGILLDGTRLAAVRATGGTFGWMTSSTGTFSGYYSAAIRARACDLVTIDANVIDGSGFLDPAADGHAARVGIWMEDSSGVVEGNTVISPRVTAARVMAPYLVTGPQGDVTLSDNTASGEGAATTELIGVSAVATGTVRIDGGSFTATQTGTSYSYGLYVSAAPVVVTDATFRLPGDAGTLYGLYAVDGASVRAERTRFRVDGDLASTTYGVAAYFHGATLELYDSWLRSGAGSSYSIGLVVGGATSLRLIGNTIDGGGLTSQSASHALYCHQATVGTSRFSSNLFDGGDASAHRMIYDPNSDCGGPSAYDHNYFMYGGSTGRYLDDTVTTAASAAVGVPDAEGDIVGDATSCFDGAFPQPDFHIAAGSPCVNRGVAGTRADGSALTTDLLGGARVQGGTADIGAHEVQ